MFTDFDKLFFDSEVQTEKDTVGLAVYHLDIEMGVKPEEEQIAELIQSSRPSINQESISSYLSDLNNALLKKESEGYKLNAEGIEYYEEKISRAESSFKYTEKFVNVDSIPKRFYEPLVSEINKAYSHGLSDAALVLTRKLLENLLVDILRSKFGPQNNLELYFDEDKRHFKSFSDLIENFRKKSGELETYYSTDTQDIIGKLESLRVDANSSAHSIETELDREELDEFSSDIDFLARLLFDIREKVE